MNSLNFKTLNELGLSIAIFTAIAAVIVTAVIYALGKSEINECAKLKKMETEYQGFYSTNLEKAMCADRGIILTK